MPITNLSDAQHIFIVTGYTDLRKGIDGLLNVITTLIDLTTVEADTVVNSELKMYLNKGTTFDQNVSYQEDIVVTKLGLKIPKTNGLIYWQFSRQMRISERRLLDSIKNMHLSESK